MTPTFPRANYKATAAYFFATNSCPGKFDANGCPKTCPKTPRRHQAGRDLSPAETFLLDLLDIWDVLSARRYQPTAGDLDENEDETTSTLRRLLSPNPNISAVPSEPEPEPDSATSPSSQHQHPGSEQQEQEEDERAFRKIGAGQCGAVFAPSLPLRSGGRQAYKFAKVASSLCSPAQGENNLINEKNHQLRIREKFRWHLGDTTVPHTNNWNSTAEGSSSSAAAPSTPVMGVTMPRVSGFTLAQDITPETVITPHERGLVAAVEKEAAIHHPLPTDYLKMERIFPLPLAARNALIDRYLIGTDEAKQAAKSDPANADCLVRVYLGANKDIEAGAGAGGRSSRFFSLRNFKLHLNQLADLGLESDALQMAKEMAFSLAVMHWAAKTDGRDVEFVLGSSRERYHNCPHQKSPGLSSSDSLTCPECPPVLFPSSPSSSAPEPQQPKTPDVSSEAEKESPSPEPKQRSAVRSTQLWLLDFNQCRTITYTPEGVAKMVEAVKLNDPYFPKPLRQSAFERAVWTVFVRAYLAASELVLEAELRREWGPGLSEILERGFREMGETQEIFKLPRRFILGVIQLERSRIQQRGRTSTSA